MPSTLRRLRNVMASVYYLSTDHVILIVTLTELGCSYPGGLWAWRYLSWNYVARKHEYIASLNHQIIMSLRERQIREYYKLSE